jgi:hypothetical protein
MDWERVALRHVCPLCGAESGYSCTSANGAFTLAHSDRIQFVKNCLLLAAEALPGEPLLEAYRRIYMATERKESQ